ncbi:MAG: hypothetical protein ACKOB4_06030 [Acidobacteriota bacterium]
MVWVVMAMALGWWRWSGPGYGVQGDLPLHYHITRNMLEGMKAGEWGLDWAGLLEGGRGSSLFTFYPPLFYWLTGMISLAGGVSILGSLKLATLLILVFNQWSAWRLAGLYLARGGDGQLSGWPRLAASLLGAVMPGLALIGLNRGFLPQALGMGFLPLVIDGAARILRGERGGAARLSLVGGLCGVVLAHAISAYLTVVALGLLLVSEGGWRERVWWRRLGEVAGLCLLGAGLTAFFWMPQLVEMGWVKMDMHIEKQDYRDYLLFAPAANDSPYRRAWQGLNEVAGLVTIGQSGLVLLAGLLAWRRGRGQEAARSLIRFGIACALFGVLISLPALEILWRVVPGLPFVQFPWRWQPVMGMLGGLLVVLAFRERSGGGGWWRLVGGSVVIGLLVAGLMLTIQLCRPYGGAEAARQVAALTGSGVGGASLTHAESRALQDGGSAEFLRYTANLVYFRPSTAETTIYPAVDQPGGLEIKAGQARVTEQRRTLEARHFRIEATTPLRARLVSYAYPHWRATRDGEPIPIRTEAGSGLMEIELPAGAYEVRFDYLPPRYPQWVAALTLLGAIIWMLARRRRSGAWYTAVL